MDGISLPRSLGEEGATLRIADALQKLSDPAERKKIEADIVAHHALNDAEAKKSADARALIKKHSDVLEETRRIAEQNKRDSAELSANRISFQQECEAERMKISEEWSNARTASETAKNIQVKAEGMINDVAAREESLRQAKERHALDVKKLADKQKEVEKTLLNAEEIKRQHTELLEDIKNKQAAIAAFRI